MKAITISSSSSRNIQSNHGRRLKTNSRKAKLSLLLIQRIIFVGILCFVLLYLLLVNMAMSSSSSTEKKTTLSSGSLEKNGEPRIKRQVDTKRINAVGTPEMANTELKIRPNTILTAYLEPPIDLELWQNVKPLSIRNVTAKVLTKMQFPGLNSCSKLPEQWPVNDYPQEDPFLPVCTNYVH